MNPNRVFDTYALRAQLFPALLTILPLGLAVISWTGKGPILAPAIGLALGSCGACFAVAAIARNRGRELQSRLWLTWGGPPTTQLLRHCGTANSVLRERWHLGLGNLVGRRFPTKEQEAAAPEEADEVYEASVRLLISNERKSPSTLLIARENANYGFCRNLLALKPIGITSSLFGAAGSFAATWLGHGDFIISGVCTILSGLILLAWLFIVTADWVKAPAFAYAERLLECTPVQVSKKTRAVEPSGRKSNSAARVKRS
jgi:hypothetical protein